MADKSKTGFFAYYEWAEVIKDLPDEIQAKFFRAMFQYAATGEVKEELNSMELVAWNLIKGDIARQQEKYARIVEKRREAGKKGMESRWGKGDVSDDEITNDSKSNKCNENITNDSKTLQDLTNITNKSNIKSKDKSKDKHKYKSNSNNKNYQEDNIISSSSSKEEEEEEKKIKIQKRDFYTMFEVLKKEIPDDGKRRDLGRILTELKEHGIETWRDVSEIVRSCNYGEAGMPIWTTFDEFKRGKWRPDNMRAYLKKVAKDRY